MSKRRRSFLFLPLIILACSLLGGIYGPALNGAATNGSEDEIQASIKSFTKMYNLVEDNFADKVDPDRSIYKGAVPGMLRTLDPHSNFFDPRDFQLLREDQRGQYFGVGMTVAPDRGKTIVIAPFPGSPAQKAGIRPGDLILSVDGKPTDNLTVSEVADMLKGPRGTEVTVTVSREGSDEPLTFKIVRDEIPRKSVQQTFWLRPGIAFIDVDSFNENTSKEVEDGLAKLGEENIQGLILDLRSNPGGLLNEGVAVADHFLHKGQVIVSHRGRASAERSYKAKQGNKGRDYPIVVLVNQYSASAAEIVSGALQDHDRAWVLGENTFGKGLVQTVYPLAENTGLALTTAKYYTPSGRLIQRDYSNVSFIDYYAHKKTDLKNPQDVRMTDSGRTVYGGGGITPDEKFTEPKLNAFQIRMLQRHAFLNFASKYLNTSGLKVTKEWEPDHIVTNDFHQFLLKNGYQFSEVEFTDITDWMKLQLKKEFYIAALGTEQAQQLAVLSDPSVAKAIEALPKAKALLETAQKVIAQRTNPDSQ